MARDPAEIHRFCFGARFAMAAGSHSKEGRARSSKHYRLLLFAASYTSFPHRLQAFVGVFLASNKSGHNNNGHNNNVKFLNLR